MMVDHRTELDLLAALQNPDVKVRASAAGEIGRLGIVSEAAMSALAGLLADKECLSVDTGEPDEDVWGTPNGRTVHVLISPAGAALETLVSIGAPVIPFLEEALRDPARRSIAITAISRMWSLGEQTTPLLIGLLSDPDALTEVLQAIDVVGERARAAVPHLIPLIKHTDYRIRFLCLCTLRKMGSHARSAIPALRAAVDDPFEYVGEAARKTLQIIEAAVSVAERIASRSTRGSLP